MKTQFLRINGATLWLAQQGLGLPVVLISGGPGCSDYLEPVAKVIDDVAQTIRFDWRGCGRSSHTPPYNLQTAISDLDMLRSTLNLEQWVVLGHSWGADVALAYALTHPSCTMGVIYLSGRGLQNDSDWKEAYRKGRDAGQEQIPEFAYPPNPEVNAVANDSWKVFIKQPTLWKRISLLTVPMLAVAGSKDIRPSWPVKQVVNLMPCACFHQIEGAGHYLWLTHLSQLSWLIHDFLANL